MSITLEELAMQQSVYESDKYCHVCHGNIETAFYADINSFDGKTDWLWRIKTNDGEKKLKRCTRCGLLYAK